MNISRWASSPVVTAERTESVLEIARKMREGHVGNVVIVEKGEHGEFPLGIVTDRDIAIEVVARNLTPSQVMAGEIMTDELTVAYETDDVEDVIELMKRSGVRRIPLVNHKRFLTGIVSMDDLLGTGPSLEGLPKIQRNWEKESRV